MGCSMYSLKTGSFCHQQPKADLRDSFHRQERGYFSRDAHGQITLDQSQLRTYQLKHSTMLNVHNGSSGYKPRIFKRTSQLKDFLTALGMLEDRGTLKVGDYQLICQSNFFQSAALLRQSEYYVISHKGQLFIVNSETREGQSAFMSYIGIRFEDLLTMGANCPPTVSNDCSYNSIVETTVAGMKCLYTCEIDTYRPVEGSQEVLDERYTEVKLILSKKIPLKNAKNQEILKVLRKGSNAFEEFLYRLNVQCRFGNNHNVVLGIRDAGYNVRILREFSLSGDIERCFKSLHNPIPQGVTFKYAVGGYDGYLRSVDYIEGVLGIIKKAVQDGNDVCKVRIRTDEIDVVPVTEKSQRTWIVDHVLFKDFKRRL